MYVLVIHIPLLCLQNRCGDGNYPIIKSVADIVNPWAKNEYLDFFEKHKINFKMFDTS